MIDKPCCETCTHFGKSEYDQFCSKVNIRVYSSEKELITLVGCLSHPQAREYLMKDVIKELEKQIIDAKRHRNHERVAGYEKAITLIRGGVKK